MKMEKLPEITFRELNGALSRWDMPEIPNQTTEDKAEPELAMSNWLYELARRNVKRGRFFQLRDVLLHQQADCLGYAKLISRIGQKFALDAGIVEVIIDNAGRYTPHYINIVKLSSGRRQFLDLWYGSRDIKHRRIGAQIREGGKWWIKDLNWNELEDVEDIKGLPKKAVTGITHYILGNRHLEKGIRDRNRQELDCAIAHYTTAIRLYPGYARAYFNRAIAHENNREYGEASLDYAQALRDESSQVRVLAREHEDVIRLIELDRANIEIREQEIYLLRKGFITGKEIASADVAREHGISEDAVDKIISIIEAQLIATP